MTKEALQARLRFFLPMLCLCGWSVAPRWKSRADASQKTHLVCSNCQLCASLSWRQCFCVQLPYINVIFFSLSFLFPYAGSFSAGSNDFSQCSTPSHSLQLFLLFHCCRAVIWHFHSAFHPSARVSFLHGNAQLRAHLCPKAEPQKCWFGKLELALCISIPEWCLPCPHRQPRLMWSWLQGFLPGLFPELSPLGNLLVIRC